MSATQPTAGAVPAATLLFVDDEANILSSLQRLFRPLGYRIFTATSGAQGLEILEKEKIDLVISDMRMPHMDGATFLGQVVQRWPQVTRLLLTGYSDLTSAIAAVNVGGIYRYLHKPWEDNDLKLAVHNALEHARLGRTVQHQNEELKTLNTGLEERVKARTEEVRQVLGQLQVTHEELKKSYFTAVKVFAGLIELREPDLSGHARRVADHARKLALAVGMKDSEVQDVMVAALLHDVGKIGLPDALLTKPFSVLTAAEREQVMKHPVAGQTALLALDPLALAADLIRAHHERFDGQGYPDRLAGERIPLGARILAVVNEYDALQCGTLVEGRLGPAEARAYLQANRGTHYDPRAVDAYFKVLDEFGTESASAREVRLGSDSLQPGMLLSRDLVNSKGMLLLPKGRELNAATIARIRAIEKDEDRGYTIHVHAS